MSWKFAALLAFALAAYAQPQPGSTLLYSECSDTSQIARVLQSSDTVAVRHSFSGGSQACYSVSVTARDGQITEGFLLGAHHPAIIEFERQQQSYISRTFSPPGPKKASPKTQARARQHSHTFWNPFTTHSGTK